MKVAKVMLCERFCNKNYTVPYGATTTAGWPASLAR